MIPFIWSTYSRRFDRAILKPKHMGFIDSPRGRLVMGKVEGQVDFFLDVDEGSGQIQQARFHLFGPTLLVAACEGVCALALGKTVAQAGRISVGLIERELEFPKGGEGFIEIAKAALLDALAICSDITAQVISPISCDFEAGDRPDFNAMSEEEKIAFIESALDEKIRPFIELDSGSVIVKELKGLSLTIAYEGACTTCPASVGSTLQAITETLRNFIDPNLVVTIDPLISVD